MKNVLIYYNCSEYFENMEEKNIYSNICSISSDDKIYKMIEILLAAIKSSKTTNNIKLIFELSIIKIIELNNKKEEKIQIKQVEIPVYEEKKEIKKEIKIEKNQISVELSKEINEIKKIRINNALAKFNKKQLLEFKKNFDDIKELLMDPDYSSIVSLMLDGEIKVKGDDYIIFVYDSKNLDEYFNSVLFDVEKALNKVFTENLKPIAIASDSWEIIKTEFNNSLKQKKKIYNFIEETYSLEKIFNKKENKEKNIITSNNEIEKIFEDIIVYN